MMGKTRMFLILLALGALLAGCSNTETPNAPTDADKLATAVVRGEFTDGTFDYEFDSESPGGANDPAAGAFKVRIRDLAYDSGAGVLNFNMWLVNASTESYPAPVRLTFMQLTPSTISVLNADNDEMGSGAMFNFAFADSDSSWGPDEVTAMRSVEFQVPAGNSISFVSKVEIGEDLPEVGGTIGGTVWNDRNGDGVMDPGEEGVPGVGILLNAGAKADSTAMMMDAMTDSVGQYSFGALDAGHYTVMVRQDLGGDLTTAPVIDVLLVEYDGVVADFLEADFGVMYDDMSDSLMVGSFVNAKGEFMTDPDRLESEIFNYGTPDSSGYCDDDHDGWGGHDDDDDDHMGGGHDGWGGHDDDNDDHMGGDDDHQWCDGDHDYMGGDDDYMGGEGQCWGRLSGPITGLDLENGALQVMGTWVSFPEWDPAYNDSLGGGMDFDPDFELGMRVRVNATVESTDDGDKVVACGIHFWNGNGDRVRGVVQEILRNDDGVITAVRVLNTLVTVPQ